MQQAAAPKISFVSLGCPKALVDSERIITRLRAEGYELARKHDGADIVIVNTCGFLDSAKQESLGAIGEAMAENGKVIVTGCMGAEPEQIEAAYPGVLSISGPQQYESVLEAVHRALPPMHNPHLDLVPPQGIKLTPRHYAYLKISEGCNNRCSFCIIPKLRGDLVSRPANDVLREAEKLVAAGVKELLVISQDTSGLWRRPEIRGKPVAGSPGSREVLRPRQGARRTRRLGAAAIRLPLPACRRDHRPDDRGKVLPYLDIPFQHASPEVLKAMKRPAAQEKTLARIHKWREQCPELTLRSTFIVGFPARRIPILPIYSIGLKRPKSIASAASNTNRSRVRLRTRLATRCPGARQAGSLECTDGAAAENFGAPPEAQGRYRQQIIIDEVGPTVSKAAPRPTLRRSMARSISRAAVRCASARSSPRKSSARMNTICTQRRGILNAPAARLT